MKTKQIAVVGMFMFFLIGLATGFWIAAVYAKSIVDAAQ
jgi:uncharacterized protein YneF (UPF0154 family)